MRSAFTAVVCGTRELAIALETLGARALNIGDDLLISELKTPGSPLECDVFLLEAVRGNPLTSEPAVHAMNVAAALRGLPDSCTMSTGVR